METPLKPTIARLFALSFALLTAAAYGAAPPLSCLIEPERVAEVGSPVTGVIDSMRVDRGDHVTAGQPLVLLRADVERANMEMVQTRAKLEADIAAAAANVQLAKQKLVRAEKLHEATYLSKQGLDQAAAEHELAVQKLAQAKEQISVTTRELSVAQAQVGLRTIRSPFNGVIVERYVNPGERVEDKPLLRVAMIDPLRVEVLLPASLYGTIRTGSELTIRPELPNAAPVRARVTRVDKVLDPASNTFRVRLSLANAGNKLPAGLRCKVDLPESVAGEEQKSKPAAARSERASPPAQQPGK
jgi:RND family efflux transporter MFP subunit